MAADVTTTLRNCTGIGHVVCLGEDPLIRTFSTEQDCEFIAELEGAGLSANLDHAARQLQANGAQTLLIIPSDLPTITTNDVDALLREHCGGLTICPAGRDGGTNALVISPPTGIGFLFGEQSCERHILAAKAAGLEHRVTCPTAFQCDIDRPTDLVQLCSINPMGHTGKYLSQSGIRSAFRQPPSVASA
jgi:2-phospho-L-lactate guanylyltransferase